MSTRRRPHLQTAATALATTALATTAATAANAAAVHPIDLTRVFRGPATATAGGS